jgi:fibronectin type 3 domain-containing protein
MKENRLPLSGMAAIALIFAVALTGCEMEPKENPPDAPVVVTATAVSSSRIQISWDAVPGATSYDVYYIATSSISFQDLLLAGNVTETSYTHTGLEPSKGYRYYIKAKNGAGESNYSGLDLVGREYDDYRISANAATWSNVPYNVVATTESSRSISVSWDEVPDATSYDVYYSIGASDTRTFVASVTETSCIHTGLEPGTRYYYYIKAKNSEWESDYSDYDVARTLYEAPSTAPTSVTAVAQSTSSIKVTWSEASSATSYNVCRATSADGPYASVGTPTTISYIDTGLGESTTYYYKVSAVNDAGEGPQSSYSSATTLEPRPIIPIPSIPTGVTAHGTARGALSTGIITISWNAVPGATSYRIYSPGKPNPSLADPFEVIDSTSTTFYTFSSAYPGESWYFRVSAVNSAGASAQSSMVSVLSWQW